MRSFGNQVLPLSHFALLEDISAWHSITLKGRSHFHKSRCSVSDESLKLYLSKQQGVDSSRARHGSNSAILQLFQRVVFKCSLWGPTVFSFFFREIKHFNNPIVFQARNMTTVLEHFMFFEVGLDNTSKN